MHISVYMYFQTDFQHRQRNILSKYVNSRQERTATQKLQNQEMLALIV
jgi:hypothetical protein